MLKSLLLSAAVLLSSWTLPDIPEPFLAVYASKDIADYTRTWDWSPHHPDLYYTATSWYSFPKFIEKVKEQAGDRPIQIDIQVHGLNSAWIFIDQQHHDWGMGGEASMGYIVNSIESGGIKPELVFLEACYAGWVYESSIRDNFNTINPYMQDCDHIPQFPILGQSGHTANLNNMTFLEWKYGYTTTILDLRIYEGPGMEPPAMSYDWEENPETGMWELVVCPHLAMLEAQWEWLTMMDRIKSI